VSTDSTSPLDDGAVTGAVTGSVSDGVSVVTLARAEKANAYSAEMLDQLRAEVELADADPEIRVIVITGQGEKNFCAGADRTEIAERDWQSVLTMKSESVFRRVRESECVTIAAINGAAVGGGMELAMACDLRLASETARFWLPEPNFGLLPAAGGTRLLAQLVGPLRAKELILAGRVWSAREAFAAGFLTEVVGSAELAIRTTEWAARIVKRDPSATRFAKELIDKSIEVRPDSGPDLVVQSILVARGGGRIADRSDDEA
jgi:enoyl-CoA hydratase/carnithine racemase